jgi:hypothetical protein
MPRLLMSCCSRSLAVSPSLSASLSSGGGRLSSSSSTARAFNGAGFSFFNFLEAALIASFSISRNGGDSLEVDRRLITGTPPSLLDQLISHHLILINILRPKSMLLKKTRALTKMFLTPIT